MIKMIVFDMAGTTVNGDNVVYKTVQQAINEQGYNFTLQQVLAEGAGKEKLQAIKSVLSLNGVNDNVLAETAFERFKVLLESAYAKNEIKQQSNAVDLFVELRRRDIKVVLNTGYDRKTAETLLSKLNWTTGRQIDGLVTASDVNKGRPHPDMIILAMQQQGIADAGSVIKIGDSIIDIEEGKNAGCRLSIGITTGAQTSEQMSQVSPDHIINNLLDILPIIDTIN